MTVLNGQLSERAPQSTTPTLYFERQAWRRLSTYVQRVGDVEINGFAYVRLHEGNFYVLGSSDVFITKQTVTAGTAKVEGNIFAKATWMAQQANRDDDLRLQWHSHVHGQAYFSPTDLGTIQNYGEAGMDWFISLVTNTRGEVAARVDSFHPFQLGCAIPVVVYESVNDAGVLADIEANVTVQKPSPQQTSGSTTRKSPRRRSKTVIGAEQRTA